MVQSTVFAQVIADLWTQIGLHPDAAGTSHPARLIVDDVCIRFSDRHGTHLLLEAEILRLAGDLAERNAQLATALRANVGLLLDCEATIHLARNEDGDFLVARAMQPYTVTASGKLIRAIEDMAALVDLIRRATVPAGHAAHEAARADGQHPQSFSRSSARHR